MATASEDGRMQAMLRAAQLYYLQDQTMEAIAADLGRSRSSVSRLLARARETGVVEIRLNSPLASRTTLEGELGQRYGVAAHVVPVSGPISDVDRLDRVATMAARLLIRFFDSNMTMGVAWGSTTSAISRHLVPHETHNSVIVQMNGAGNLKTTGIEYAGEILQRFASAFSAQVEHFPVPAFFDDPLTRDALWRERGTRRVLGIQTRMDVALFGLGSPYSSVPSYVYIGGYLDEKDYRSLRQQHVAGDVATVFYRRDGTHRDITLNARASGMGLDRLQHIARRIAVVSGLAKRDAVLGALAAGLVTDLVLDEDLARALLVVGRHG
ncbi:sugar-binding transcriptional regulator [Microbacterium ulmi]|uniref:Sugar-binding transcriptional regulator n=1 Tax=Microbacterium ulmi TaxID=179095 RepID=A0A7Y2PZM0_9MICO|nr:sugar-binding domain-containing protein [Microbacterium ulmi]NII69969.1 DNA-binding transcriptional regulator LsrR (DeoR family) [Microbacterium ulmi]NNH04601.1 sugar-binding transcriptional regulator [Microbacterium ulmi]